VSSGVKYLHDHDIVHRDLRFVALPLCEIFGPDKWPGDRPENILFRTKDPSSDIVIADFGMYVALTYSQDTSHMRVSQPSSAKHLESAGEQLASLAGSLG